MKPFTLRKEEEHRAALMFGYIFLIIAALLVVKPVRNSLFLTEFGPEQLPYAFILSAAVSALVAFLYARLASRFVLNRLIEGWLVFSTLCLLASWVMLHNGVQAGWFIYAFYVWVAIFGVISASQFWLLANYVFNAREAKRVFGLLGAGGIAGAIFGGYLTKYLAPVLGTDHLIFLCVGFLGACLLLLRLIWTKPVQRSVRESHSEKHRGASSADGGNPIKLILQSRHLTYLAGLIGVGVLVANLVEYQFNAIASGAIRNEDQLTAFFGFWYSNLSILSLTIQLFLTGRVLRLFGVGASLYFLPGAVFIGALSVLFIPVLGAAVLIKLCEGAFKQSINKAGVELLALPIPSGVKNRTKTVIDVFVDNAATGIGGVLLLLLTVTFGLGVRHISLVIMGVIIVWGVVILLARREYLHSFRLAIEKRTINIEDPSINLNDASVWPIIQRVFEGSNARQIATLLRVAENTAYDRIAPFFERLIRNPSGEVKARVLRMAISTPEVDLTEQAQILVRHTDSEVRVGAIKYLCCTSSDQAAVFEIFLRDEDLRVQTAAIIAAAEEYRDHPSIREEIDIVRAYKEVFDRNGTAALSAPEVSFLAVSAAEVIGIAQVPELNSFLHKLLEHASMDVLGAAVISAGHTRAPEFVPKLIQHLGAKGVRRNARSALAQYGEEVIDALVPVLHDPDASEDGLYGVTRVLSMIESQRSVDVLLEHTDEADPKSRFEMIKALNKLRTRVSSLTFDAKRIESLIIKEVKAYYDLLAIRRSVNTHADSDRGDRPAHCLLERAIQERLDKNLERIFRLLGLKYPPDDMYNAYRGIVSRPLKRKANAIEFLDNLLDHPLKRWIIPMIERPSTEEGIQLFPSPYKPPALSGADALTLLLEGEDHWLRACALFLIAELREPELRTAAVRHTRSALPIVRETAEYAGRKLEVCRA
ncbi:MAG: hypothetical protein KAR36_12590 [Candidatus Latescibacteria bacterium]|nr:hypothetical protein [Candidatus Latescibacterota bacterium]